MVHGCVTQGDPVHTAGTARNTFFFFLVQNGLCGRKPRSRVHHVLSAATCCNLASPRAQRGGQLASRGCRLSARPRNAARRTREGRGRLSGARASARLRSAARKHALLHPALATAREHEGVRPGRGVPSPCDVRLIRRSRAWSTGGAATRSAQCSRQSRRASAA